MKKDKFELTEKKYVRAEKRWRELLWEKHSKKWRELKEPYQDGWTLFLGLRADAIRRVDGALLLAALKACSYTTYTKDPKLVSKIRSNPKLDVVRKLFPARANWLTVYEGYNGAAPALHELAKTVYDKLDKELKTLFYSYTHVQPARWGMEERKEVRYVLDIPLYYIIVKVKKRIVTHIQDINPALMKEMSELELILEAYWRTCHRSRDWRERNTKLFRSHWKEIESKLKTSEIEEPSEVRNKYFKV